MKKLAWVLALIFGAMASTSALATTPIQDGHFINLNTIKFIQCAGEDGHFAGTGFVIGRDRVVTANHVVYGAVACTIDHKPVKLVSNQPELDIAVLEVDLGPKPAVLQVSCEGFTYENTYLSFGYARAEDFAMEKMVATGEFEDGPEGGEYPFEVKGLSSLHGYMFSGMSGGPIIDMDGRVVGINNTSNERGGAASRALADTSICAALVKKRTPLYPIDHTKDEIPPGLLELLGKLAPPPSLVPPVTPPKK